MADTTEIARTESAEDPEDLHLIYEIEGKPNEVDIYDLSKALESFGEILREGNRLLSPETELSLKVRPFERGSFIMDIVLRVSENPAFLAFLASPELRKQAKEILEYLGFIKKAGQMGVSLIELLKKLRTGMPEKVEKKGEAYEYIASDGASISVTAPVHTLYNNGVVNNYIFNIAAPAARPEVDGIKTYLKGDEAATGVQITKADVPTIKPELCTAPDGLAAG
jgi:hypothetical protein